ncbi:MAG: nucleotide exchange factor GrpE [Minisyncoccia bacterium]
MTDEYDEVVVEADGSEELNQDEQGEASGKVTKLRAALETCRKEKQEYLDGWQRAKADYVNALKRFDEEKRSAVELGKVISVAAFLPVMDSLARAEGAGEIPDSFTSIAKQLHDAARALGLSHLGVVGEKFDPSIHEALGQDPTDDPTKDDTVTIVLEVGWKSKETTLRPAKVRIAHFAG